MRTSCKVDKIRMLNDWMNGWELVSWIELGMCLRGQGWSLGDRMNDGVISTSQT